MPSFVATKPWHRAAARAGKGAMVAFPAESPDLVRESCQAGIAAGPPVPRPHHGGGYFGADLRGPDGSQVHIMRHDNGQSCRAANL